MAEIAAIAATAFAAIKGAAAAVAAFKVLGVTLATWGKIAMWTAMGASMLMKPPGLPSSGMQVQLQPSGPNAPLPIVLGRTGVQGLITYREAYPDAVHNSHKNYKLAFETVVSVGPIKSISNYSLTGHSILWDRDPTRLGASTGVSICRGVSGFDSGSRVWKDGVRAAFLLGEHTDQRTLRDITGDIHLPNVTTAHKMSGLARIVQVYELDGSKNLRFPMGFPDDVQAVAEGIFAWDPRRDSTYPGGSGSQRLDQPSTWGWSENPYILALAYILGRKGPTNQKMWGIGADADDIDIPAFMHGANVADLNSWRVGGMITTDDSKDAVLSNILAAGAGQYLPGPQISVFVNEPKVSTFTLKQSMLVGDQVIRATRPMKGRFNRILVKYREPNQNYEIITGQEVSDAGYVAVDGGLRTTETVYPLIQNATQAHQIAAYELVNSREYEVDLRITAEVLAIDRGDMITVDFPIGAIESQNFIVKNWSFDASTQTVDLTLVSETTGKHDFALGRTAVAPLPSQPKSTQSLNPPAPDPSEWALVATQIVQQRPPVEPVEGEEPPEPLAPATAPAFVFEGAALEPSIHSIVVEIRAFEANRSERLPGETDAEFEARQEADWMVAFEAPPQSERIIVTDVAALTTYDVAIRYRSNLGVISPRLIFEGRQTGALSFDWNDPNVIIGVPPVLRDTDFLNALKPALEAVKDGLKDLEDANADLGQAIIDANLTITDAQGRIDAIWLTVGEDDATGLRGRIVALENIEFGDISTVVTKVEGLEAREGAALGRITSLEEVTADLDGTYAKTQAVNDLQSVVEDHTGRITTVETTVADTVEGLSQAQQAIALKASQTGLDALNTRVGTAETQLGLKASATDLSALKAVVNDPTNGLSATNSRLSSAEVEIGKRALTSTVTALSGEISTERGRINGALNRLDSVELEVDDKATIQSVQNLSGELNTERGRITSTNTRLDQVKITADGAATVQSVNNLTQTVNGYTNSINTISSLATDADNRSKAIHGFSTTVGGVVNGMISTNDGYNPKVKFQTDTFEVVPSSGTGARFELSNGALKIHDAANQKRIHLGLKAS